jgi:hypothetical protein
MAAVIQGENGRKLRFFRVCSKHLSAVAGQLCLLPRVRLAMAGQCHQ